MTNVRPPGSARREREAFGRAVHEKWAGRFAVASELLRRPGTEIAADEQFADTGGIHIWLIGQHAFVRMDPACVPVVRQALDADAGAATLTAGALQRALRASRIRTIEHSDLLYLYPPDFRPALVPEPFVVRRLVPEDASALDQLQATCTDEEVEMAEVAVQDEIGFGCFLDRQMVAIATGFRLTGFMDIGVLTHRSYRRRGLGKVVVSALSAWCITAGFIAQYRCLTTNTGSLAIAVGLNYQKYFSQQSIYLDQEPRVEGA